MCDLRWPRGVAGLALVLSACALPVGAVDKSGVKPSVISLPSGPGSIEGLGESFEPQLNTGTSSYAIPLATLPGRAGFAPDLALVYNSGGGNDVLGLGWSMRLPWIQRQTDKGLPFYVDTANAADDDQDGTADEFDELDTLIHSSGEELVPLADGSWRCETRSTSPVSSAPVPIPGAFHARRTRTTGGLADDAMGSP